jgi:hypothetical protein
VRGRYVDPFGDAKAGVVRIDDERDVAALSVTRLWALVERREHDVVIGDTGVGDPGLLAIEHEAVALTSGHRLHRADVRAGAGLRDRERRDALSLRHIRQVAALQRVRPKERDGSGAQPLHGERKVGERGGGGERFAKHAEGARVELLAHPAIRGGNDVPQPPRLTELPHERAAGRVDVVGLGRIP